MRYIIKVDKKDNLLDNFVIAVLKIQPYCHFSIIIACIGALCSE
jgi:hypothetical protein